MKLTELSEQIDCGIAVLAKSLKSNKPVDHFKLWYHLSPKAKQCALFFLPEIQYALQEKFPVESIRKYTGMEYEPIQR